MREHRQWRLILFGCVIFGPFRAVCGGTEGGLWAMSKVESSGFILLVSFIDTLLAVSILDMFYDCHLRPLLQF